MSTTMQPPAAAPKNVNRLGFTIAEYKGGDSTLCAGCGHDAITSQIIKAFYEYGVEPYRVAKAQRHRLLQQDAGIFPEPVARL